jgi:hypothetical protein
MPHTLRPQTPALHQWARLSQGSHTKQSKAGIETEAGTGGPTQTDDKSRYNQSPALTPPPAPGRSPPVLVGVI